MVGRERSTRGGLAARDRACGPLRHRGEVCELLLRELDNGRLRLLLPAAREGLGLVEAPPQVLGRPPELGHLAQLDRHRLRLARELVTLLAQHGELRLRLRPVRRVLRRHTLERRRCRLRGRTQLLA